MARTSGASKLAPPAPKPAAHASGHAAPVKVRVDGTLIEVEGVRHASLSALIKTISQGAAKGRSAGGAEFTVRFTGDGAVLVSEIRTPDLQPAVATAPPLVTERSAETEQAFAAARERGRHRVAELLERPDMLSAEAFGERLGLSRVAVNDRRQRRELLGLEGAKRGFRYPDWQIGEDGKPFEALPKLFDLLGDSPWAVYRFLVQAHAGLGGRSGLDVVRAGHSGEVLDVAESVARGDFD